MSASVKHSANPQVIWFDIFNVELKSAEGGLSTAVVCQWLLFKHRDVLKTILNYI
jgi:hypothetical protein